MKRVVTKINKKRGRGIFSNKKVLRNGAVNDEKSSKMAVTVFGIFRSDYV